LVLDRLGTRADDTRRLAAVAYTVHNAQILLANKANRDALLQSTTPDNVFDANTQFIEAGPNGIVYPLNDVAAKKASELDGFQFHGSTLEKVSDFSVDGLALAASARAPIAAATVKLLYPPTKEAVAHLVDRDPRSPDFEQDFTVEWASWAYDQVQQGTPEGLALGPYVSKYQNVDPKKDNSSDKAVQEAKDRMVLIKTSKTANDALSKIVDIQKTQTDMAAGIDDINERLANRAKEEADAAEKAKALSDRVRAVQNVAGTLQLTSYLFEIGGDKNAARTIGQLANAANGVSNLMQTAATAAPMALAAGYVGIAIAVVSAFQSSHDGPSPFPAIFAMLQQISQQIESLRAQLSNSIAALDTHLSSMLSQTNVTVDAINYNVQELQLQTAEIRRLIDDYNADNAQRIVEIAGLIQRGEDRDCFQWTGELKLLPLTQKEFIKCRDLYNDRATTDAKAKFSTESKDSIATASLPRAVSLFPYSENYETLREDIRDSQADNPHYLVNPAIWFRSTTLLMALVQHSPEYLSDVTDFFVGPTIEAGDDLKHFVDSVALQNHDGIPSLRKDRFTTLIDQISTTQGNVLEKIKSQIDHPPIQAPVNKGLEQAPNYDKQYQMFAKKGLVFCKDVKPNLKKLENFTWAQPGGEHGTDRVLPPNFVLPFQGPKDWRAIIESQVRGVDYGGISIDSSVLKAIDPTVVLMEQIRYKNAEMSYCISQFDITRLAMAGQTQVDFDIRIKIFLTLHELEKDTTFQVQELQLTRKTTTPFYTYFYINFDTPRPAPIILGPWAQFQGHFDQLFTPVANADADQNRKLVHDDLDNFFKNQKATMYRSILGDTSSEIAELSRLKTELLALTQIGLDFNNPAVLKWINSANNDASILSAEAMANKVILQGKAVDDVRHAASTGTDALKIALDELAKRRDLMPDATALSERLGDLRKVLALRATLASTKRANR
jgi:hypothetical protein